MGKNKDLSIYLKLNSQGQFLFILKKRDGNLVGIFNYGAL